MSLNDLIAISTDKEATAAALRLDDINLHPNGEIVRGVAEQVSKLYKEGTVDVTPKDVIWTNATTGANTIVIQALLSTGDHVICTFPGYAGLVEVPRAMGCDVSLLNLCLENDWQIDMNALKSLVKPDTKMIILNNPHNPCGSIISTSQQKEIIQLAKEHNIVVFCDEIFRPLYHTDEKPCSMLEHSDYDRVVTTGSLSKAWGFPGIRIGWIATRNAALRAKLWTIQGWILQDVSVVDSIIAREILSERCGPQIMAKNNGYAHENLKVLVDFTTKHKDVISCSIPAGGATAFPKFLLPGGQGHPVDDVDFCQRLLNEQGLLLSPATQCFGPDPDRALKGHMRLAITKPPAQFRAIIDALEAFISSSSYAELK